MIGKEIAAEREEENVVRQFRPALFPAETPKDELVQHVCGKHLTEDRSVLGNIYPKTRFFLRSYRGWGDGIIYGENN